MKKNVIKRVNFLDETCGFRWVLSISLDERQATEWVCKTFGVPFPHQVAFGTNGGSLTTWRDTEFLGAIWVNSKLGGSTWAHECTHGALHVAKVLGIDPIAGEEFVATYVGYLMKKLTKLHFGKR